MTWDPPRLGSVADKAVRANLNSLRLYLTALEEEIGAGGAGSVPTGGVAGDYLKKDSGTDYDTSWDALGALAQLDTVGSAQIDNDSIVNADINSAAAIEYTKLDLTGGIVNADIAPAAAIEQSKIADLEADLAALGAGAYSWDIATVNINTSTAENDLINFQLLGGDLQDGDILWITAGGDGFYNSGAPTITWKVRCGAVTQTSGALSTLTDANLRRWRVDIRIRRSADVFGVIETNLPMSNAVATVQLSPYSTIAVVGNTVDISNFDFDNDQTVRFTIQHSVSSASVRTRMYGYSARILRA